MFAPKPECDQSRLLKEAKMWYLYQVTQNIISWQGLVALWFKSITAKVYSSCKGPFQYSPVTSLETIHYQAGVAQCRGNQHLKLVLNQLPKAWGATDASGAAQTTNKEKRKNCCFQPVLVEMVKYSALSGNTVGEKREFGNSAHDKEQTALCLNL